MFSKTKTGIVRSLSIALIGTSMLLGAMSSNAAIPIVKTESGWSLQMMGLFSAWTGSTDWDVRGATAFGLPQLDAQSSFRVGTGFNPSKIEFVAVAPEFNGITVSAYFQLAHSLQGFKTRRVGEQIEIRAADIAVSGSFGQLQIGRSFGIFASHSILNDTGSMRGAGYQCVGPDGSGPNCGHIGTGYTWTDWTAGIRYASPRTNGFQFRVGIFDPIETSFGIPGGDPIVIANTNLSSIAQGDSVVETSAPLIEADLHYTKGFGPNGSNNFAFWLGAMTQGIDDNTTGASTDIRGLSLGGRLKVGGFGITANFEDTEGIAEGFMGFGTRCRANVAGMPDGCGAVEGDQFYVNLDYTAGDTVYGVSYGEGHEDASAFMDAPAFGVLGTGEVDRELVMVYVQHQLTPSFNINAEFHTFERVTPTGLAPGLFFPDEEYNAFLLGGEFRF